MAAQAALVLYSGHGEFFVNKLSKTYPKVPLVTVSKTGQVASITGPKLTSLVDLPQLAHAIVWVGVPAAWVRPQLGAGKGVPTAAVSQSIYTKMTHTFVGRGWGEVRDEARVHKALGRALEAEQARQAKELKKAQKAHAKLEAKTLQLVGRWRLKGPPPYYVPQELR